MRSLVLAVAMLSLAVPPAFAEDDDGPPLDEKEAIAREQAAAHRVEHLQLHQALGLGMLASMATTAGLGLAQTNGLLGVNGQLIHIGMASLTTGLYLGAATAALTAPPPAFSLDSNNMWDTAGIHRNLAWLHAAGMLSTVGLGIMVYNGANLTDLHGLAGLTTLGLVGTSAAVITFGQ